MTEEIKEVNIGQPKKLSDVLPKIEEAFPEVESIKSDSLINKDFEILGFAERSGNFGDFTIVKIKIDGKETKFNTSGNAVVKKLKVIEENFGRRVGKDVILTTPILTKFVQRTSESGRRYYELE